MLRYKSQLKKCSQRLRREMTNAERMLWQKIRCKQLKDYQFFRQKPIGKYVVDFYCPKARLIIEVDGGQHYEKSGYAKDEERDKELGFMGFKIIRYTNLDIIKNLNNVIEDICKILPNPPL